jgi:hypothetical protein
MRRNNIKAGDWFALLEIIDRLVMTAKKTCAYPSEFSVARKSTFVFVRLMRSSTLSIASA